ncbi:MAG: C69 family dipeptidase [Bacteroidales bacterium]|nr:C69 family dipeptidase [Bacteroidales bacterium]
MKNLYLCFLSLMIIWTISNSPAYSCTTMIITKGASADGSMMIAHSDDDELGDQRMILVPSHQQRGFRKVYAEHYRYPRINTTDRGNGYYTADFPLTPVLYLLDYKEVWKILGRENPNSYAYYDGNYGIMNEYNLMIGECTNAGKYEPEPNANREEGKPLRVFYTSELSRLALENCKTAREAIVFMGALIEKFGYYSTGETLLVGDVNESWVFEMCALPDNKYHSVWVAKRVPDGEFFVAANEFRIRYIEKNNPTDFLYSQYLIPGLKKLGWWDEVKNGPIDWLKAISPGEYNHPYYSLRRVWRVLDRVNPDLGLSPWVENGFTFAYPFSVKPKSKLTHLDVFSLYRDHYEGTPFDMTKGIGAGPYGDPTRFVGPYDGNQNDVTIGKKMYGAWERPVSVFYQGYTFVCQVRPDAPEMTQGLVWFGPDVSSTTCFVPFFSKCTELNPSFQSGNPQQFDRTSAWWVFNFVNNWSRLNFQQITKSDIKPLQSKMEQGLTNGVKELDEKLNTLAKEDALNQINRWCFENSSLIFKSWWVLADVIIAKYSDGYINLPDNKSDPKEAVDPRMIGYPSVWLDATNYKMGPTGYEMK